MAAEAFWILTGDDRVGTIAPYNERIASFSDDGISFFGAYGPKIIDQLPYVLDKLSDDPCTRQAGINIWREKPEPTKDVPCTTTIFFSIRDGKLNAHVFMRSSDIWLGVPYDVFNFSMLVHLVCAYLNARVLSETVLPGNLFLTAASSHIYETNIDEAFKILEEDKYSLQTNNLFSQPDTPSQLYMSVDALYDCLKQLRNSDKGSQLRWWEVADETNKG
jgi:thymidylate synthase